VSSVEPSSATITSAAGSVWSAMLRSVWSSSSARSFVGTTTETMMKTVSVVRVTKASRAVVICPVVPFPPLGGGHKRTLRLLEAIERAGAVPHLLTDDPRSPDGVEALRDRGWGVDVVPRSPPTLRSRAAQHLRRLPSPYLEPVAGRLRALVAEGCAFVQAEHTQSAYYSAAIEPARWVLSLQNVDSELLRSVARDQRPLTPAWGRAWNRWHSTRAVERRALGRANVVLCVSEADREWIEPSAKRVLLVQNGVDDDLFEVGDRLPDAEDVLFFGQLDYAPNEHGLERFLREVWPGLATARPAARLRIAGSGMSSSLSALVDRTDRAEAVGFVPDLRAELARTRLAIVPLWQGGGTRLKALESLAAARPVVGTRLGLEGVGFEHGVHGLVADTPAELARACERLLADAAASHALAAAGRRLAEGFRWERVTAPAEALYRGWLA
jgi:glycosyltransferase involved in cell wall biosynthesis